MAASLLTDGGDRVLVRKVQREVGDCYAQVQQTAQVTAELVPLVPPDALEAGASLTDGAFCLESLPPPTRVLILHLKRYSFNAQLSLNSKLGQQVVIPRYLTLQSHCTDLTRPPVSLGWSSQAAT